MSNYLFRDFGAEKCRDIDDRMKNPVSFSPAHQVFSPLENLTKELACRRHQLTPENAPTNWYVKLPFDSTRERKALECVVVPAGEKLCLFKHLPGWNKLVDVGYAIGCGSHPMLTDIDIVKCSDPDKSILSIAAGLDLTVCTDDASPVIDQYIKRDDSCLLRVCITPPFTDADGNGVFINKPGTTCEESSCFQIAVHAHLKHMCFSETIRGCRIGEGCGCPEPAPVDPCDETKPEEEPIKAPPQGSIQGTQPVAA